MSWANIKHQHTYGSINLQDDPAEFARKNMLTGNHSVEVREQIGAWRWSGITEHRARILELLQAAERAVDFGGTAGPIGYGAVVVDREEPKENGLRALYDVPGKVDVLFTSHTLEHIVDIWLCGLCIAHKVRAGGHIIVQVPSWHNESLRAENWPHHEQTFCLSTCEAPEQYTRLDSLLGRWFDWEVATHTSDGGNIILIGERNGSL